MTDRDARCVDLNVEGNAPMRGNKNSPPDPMIEVLLASGVSKHGPGDGKQLVIGWGG